MIERRYDRVPKDVDGSPSASLSPQRASADAADLRAGIGDLAGLVAGTLGLPELLAEVSTFAVRATPGADGAGAFTQLRAITQTERRTLADVAQQIVDEAVRRARARRDPT